ncbi:hypothetical protein SUGI_0422630 [Cryptomeria japonica]|nr:hypothetical protein SUGI_0422630 [Cryptomeria japonica]
MDTLLLFIPFLLSLICSQHFFFFLEAATPVSEYPYPFMTADAEKAIARTYDYIIIGGGTAGCPLATTLSQHYSVLVLERGGSPYGNPDIEDASLWGKALDETNKYTSIAQTFVSEDGVQLARARVLGGATAINAMFYSRASLKYIRNMGWDKKLVNNSYEWVEKEIAFKPDKLSIWSSAFRDALLEAGVLPYNGYTVDHVEGTKISASTFDNNGKRHTAADFFKHANPNNIVVLLNATASRIIFHSVSGKLKARGVEFMNSVDGQSYQVFLNESSYYNEIILSAGSLGSTQLLLLSGIGPYQHLAQLNIPLLVDLPLVGKGVQDNPRSTITLESPIPLNISSIQAVAILNGSKIYIESSSSISMLNDSSIQYTGSIFEKLAFPLSRGEIKLQNIDPRDNPLVQYNYYSHPLDLNRCVEGVNVIDKLTKTTSIQHFAFHSNGTNTLHFIGEALPDTKKYDHEALAKFCRDTLNTMWHFHGGCQVDFVVDQRYLVKGVDGLRIVDGSTFKFSPGTNPQATTMMLGRYIGIKILQERNTSA